MRQTLALTQPGDRAHVPSHRGDRRRPAVAAGSGGGALLTDVTSPDSPLPGTWTLGRADSDCCGDAGRVEDIMVDMLRGEARFSIHRDNLEIAHPSGSAVDLGRGLR